MNEEERASQVSALFDGELEHGHSELVVRRIMKDPGLRAAWGRYALIGASLRHEPMSVSALGRDDVASRVASALALEPELAGGALAAPATRRGWAGTAGKAVFGTALAASVAAASILVLRMPAMQPEAPGAMVASAQVPAEAPRAQAGTQTQVVDVPAQSYTTPVGSASNAGLPAPLVNYVVAHSEYLTPVMRFNPLSAVMMGTFEPGEELVEATEAEIGASRR